MTRWLALAALVVLPCGLGRCAPGLPDVASGTMPSLDEALAGKFAALSLGCVDRPYPHKSDLVQAGEGDVRAHREATPAFFGCFDWHSAVHAHWALLTVLQRFPTLPEAARIRAVLADHLAADRLAVELQVLQRPDERTFERPYGWAWFLRLAATLKTWDDPAAAGLFAAVQPVARHLAAASITYLGRLSVPVRAGTHNNTAYAMGHMLAYARAAADADFERALTERARAFYLADTACPTAYEPSGEDFLSACLAEADLMRRVLPPSEFVPWLDRFLPDLGGPGFAPLRAPVVVKDRHDPRIGHLIGLSLYRAQAFRGLAATLPRSDPRQAFFLGLAALHAADGLAQMADSGYGGEHWLATFALAALAEIDR